MWLSVRFCFTDVEIYNDITILILYISSVKIFFSNIICVYYEMASVITPLPMFTFDKFIR